jgi:phosphoribosyl 1,2-cyclic phosphate phosphodiesterase
VPKHLLTTDIRGQFILLGTGTSVGVPSLGCGCDVCTSTDPRDKRTRTSAIVGLPEGNLLIDTGPDLRLQLLREGIGIVHAVIYTHEHADHLFGLDDLRLFPFYLGHPVPLYCEEAVERRIRRAFDYAFGDEYTHSGAAPQLAIHPLDLSPFQLLGAEIIPLRLQHGPRFQTLGFRIGNIAYCTDTNHIPGDTMALLSGLDVLIIDALRWRPHATHFCVDEAIAVAEQLKPKRTIFTHICHDLGHVETNSRLPAGMELGYDGMRVPLS